MNRVFGVRGKDKEKVKKLQVTQIAHTGDLLGESPVWCSKRQMLFWVDIIGCRVHVYTPETNATRTVSTKDLQVGCIAMVQERDAVVAAGTHEGVGFVDLKTGAFTCVSDPERHKPSNRFNDGKVSPQGDFILGTMYGQVPRKLSAANLYKWRNGHVVSPVSEVGDVSTSNGLGWTADGKLFYYIDSPTMTVKEFPWDPETGGIAGKGRVAATIPKELGGAPDGMAVDVEGMIWVALFRGGKVVRIDPATGELLAVIELPCPHITSVCFGGRYLDRLFITSAKGSSMREIQGNHSKSAGALFACDVGVRGVPMYELAKPQRQPSKL